MDPTNAISKAIQKVIYEIMDMRDSNQSDPNFEYNILINALIALKRGVDTHAFAHIGRE